jgi:carbon storage regulator
MLGDDIEIVILSIEGEAVKVGIQAPKQVEVFRKEVFEAIRQENQEASSAKISTADLKGMFTVTKDAKK